MRGISWRGWIAAALLAAAWPARAAEVSPADQISYEQQKAQAHLQELQERMFRLAELTRELEPDDSARLLLAVQKAREELIVEQMKDALALLEKKDLSTAIGEQKEVVRKLQELRDLLISTDVEFRLKLDRLRKIEEVLKKLDAAILEEDRQQGQTRELAKRADANPKEFQAAKKDQERNRGVTEAVAQLVKDLGPASASAAGDLGRAGEGMSSAEANLGDNKADEAQAQQGEAGEAMKRARRQLQAERDKLRKDLEKQARSQVLENLTVMLEKQTRVREATESLSPRAAAQERAALLAVQRQALAEDRIVDLAEQTLKLVEETRFSFALPPALRSVQRRMIYVSGDLKAARAGAEVVKAQREIEKDLADLIAAIKDSIPSPEGDPNNGEAGDCNGGPGSKLATELKIIRMLQLRVNEETTDADGRRAKADAELSRELKEKIGTTRDHQEQVRDAMEKVRQAAAGG